MNEWRNIETQRYCHELDHRMRSRAAPQVVSSTASAPSVIYKSRKMRFFCLICKCDLAGFCFDDDFFSKCYESKVFHYFHFNFIFSEYYLFEFSAAANPLSAGNVREQYMLNSIGILWLISIYSTFRYIVFIVFVSSLASSHVSARWFCERNRIEFVCFVYLFIFFKVHHQIRLAIRIRHVAGKNKHTYFSIFDILNFEIFALFLVLELGKTNEKPKSDLF